MKRLRKIRGTVRATAPSSRLEAAMAGARGGGNVTAGCGYYESARGLNGGASSRFGITGGRI